MHIHGVDKQVNRLVDPNWLGRKNDHLYVWAKYGDIDLKIE